MRWARVKTNDKLLTPCQYIYTPHQPGALESRGTDASLPVDGAIPTIEIGGSADLPHDAGNGRASSRFVTDQTALLQHDL